MDTQSPLHATCVAVGGAGVLITGASGSGKSNLALQMLALGAVLVADDRVLLTETDGHLMATCPPTLVGLIEARGIGILNAQSCAGAPVRLAVDLSTVETERIPPRREVTLLGVHIPLFHRASDIHLASAILQFMRAGRSER
ncbi:Hpr(Ser) kinase/phosphatase [Cognatiyoonia koreensis]|uniref:Hpr(Ser) kinase/phosphatase n=1 Tax=Cognatiyoonia koreensis TaxID=364200 RepID=A0A1I0RY71_9RHOB|nr:HPr kinase/phosphatase C-terminal domain-containing protein [Cognatiyoonia koreensis]SEW46426.1 Hpr(Ser) kinase/phosphatase [Cognatiyoonia koreensis]